MPEKRIRVWVQRFKDRPHLVLQWHDPVTGDRKSQSSGTADEREAEHKRADLEADLNAGRFQGAARMAWDRFRELFEEQYVALLRRNTRYGFSAVFDLFERLCHPSRVDVVNARTISAFVAKMRSVELRGGKKGLSLSTMKVRLQFLRTALRWAQKQGLLAHCPDFPSVKVPLKKPQPIPAERFEKLLARAGDDLPMRAYLLCGWLGGLRMREAYYLEREASEQVPWVCFDRDRILFPADFVKAGRDQFVPLDPQLRQALEALPGHGRRFFRFTTAGGQEVGPSTVSRRVVRLAELAGVAMSMRTLRKGFGCRYAARVPAQVLQLLMRHANIATTTTYYTNVEAAAMEAILGRNEGRNGEGKTGDAERKDADVNPGRPEGKAP
jgi:integrase